MAADAWSMIVGSIRTYLGKQRKSKAISGERNPLFGQSRAGEHNPMFGKKRPGELGGNFRGIIIGTNYHGETVAFNGKKSIDTRHIKSTAVNFDSSKVYKVINGKVNNHAGFKFFRSKEVSVLKYRLATARFYDTQSKEVIQNYLEFCENLIKERK